LHAKIGIHNTFLRNHSVENLHYILSSLISNLFIYYLAAVVPAGEETELLVGLQNDGKL
jgi:hypothetical protein